MYYLRKVFSRRHVNVRVISQRAARKGIEALQQLKVVGHNENHADIRNEGNGTDLIHEVAVHFRSFQPYDPAERHIENPRAGLLVLRVSPHSESARPLES